MSKLFQVSEEDLAALEHDLPQLADRMMAFQDNKTRTQWRRCQEILSRVRWNYGPPSEVEVIPVEE